MAELPKGARFRGGRTRRKGAVLPAAMLKKLVEQGIVPDPKLTAPKKTSLSPKEYAELVRGSLLTVEADLPNSVTFHWEGARLMTINEQLRVTTFVQLYSYKKAWHDMALLAMHHPDVRGFKFTGDIKLVVSRQAKRFVDNDALSVLFKYTIDGFRMAGLIVDDDPLNVVDIKPLQNKGEYKVSIGFYQAQGKEN